MVKPKRVSARQKVEKKLEKEQTLTIQPAKKRPEDDVATIVSTAKTVRKFVDMLK